ncbi:hypothetical protein ACY19A_00590 [Corynebacterium diphtheriae]
MAAIHAVLVAVRAELTAAVWAGELVERVPAPCFGVGMPPGAATLLTAELRRPGTGDGCATVQAPHPERVIDRRDGRIGGDTGAAAPRFDGVGVEFQVCGNRRVGHPGSTHHGDLLLLG